jgi:hypothetical protein
MNATAHGGGYLESESKSLPCDSDNHLPSILESESESYLHLRAPRRLRGGDARVDWKVEVEVAGWLGNKGKSKPLVL